MLTVAHAGPAVDQSDTVVLGIHGITGNQMTWRSVAREVAGRPGMSLLAPDLRGRGRSAALPGPYGIAAHVADMLAILDHLGVKRAVVAGHSMGAYVAARLAAEHPERVAGLVLVDGGPSVDVFTPQAAAMAYAVTVGPALARRALPFASPQGYLDFWRQHPAFAHAWNEDVEAYALHDLVGEPGALRYAINAEALKVDSDEMLSDPVNRSSLDRVHAPVRLLRAPRGTLDDDNPLIPRPLLDAFIAEHPAVDVEEVEGANHYTVVMGESPGPARVAGAIEAVALPQTA
jgi:pimeloyl-ACP methyl ester carboxylesterase